MPARRQFLFATTLLASALLLGACSDAPSAPTGAPAASADFGDFSTGTQAILGPRVALCLARGPQSASATIGSSGGALHVGGTLLLVPRGALAAPTLISGAVVGDGTSTVHFEPSGLVFVRPARLFLDARGCDITSTAKPSVLYLAPDGSIAEKIDATYSRGLGWVVAPIYHFSAYAIGV